MIGYRCLLIILSLRPWLCGFCFPRCSPTSCLSETLQFVWSVTHLMLTFSPSRIADSQKATSFKCSCVTSSIVFYSSTKTELVKKRRSCETEQPVTDQIDWKVNKTVQMTTSSSLCSQGFYHDWPERCLHVLPYYVYDIFHSCYLQSSQ